MDDIAALCQRVTALDGGRVIASGTRREIFSQPDFLHAYGLDVPPAARLAQQLRAQGWQVPDGVLFADELVAALGGNGDG
jgi:energy-coupling factor transport system ATP-binding protein